MADDWLSTLIAIAPYLALAAAVVTALSPWIRQHLQDRSQRRTRLRDFLDPIYDYAEGLKSHEPEVWPGPELWGSITPSIRDRLKPKELSAIDSLAAAEKEFEAALLSWNRHVDWLMGSPLRGSFDAAFGQYMDIHYKVRGDRVGHAANWELSDDQLFRRVYPHLVRNLDHRKEAWEEVSRSSSNKGNYVDIIVSAIITYGDEKVLDRVYEVCTTHAFFKESRDILRELDTKHAALLRQAAATCRVLKP